MSKPESSQPIGQHQLLAILEGRPCSDCPDGTLERGEYKDNDAVVCDSCGTPQVQIW